MGPSRRLRWSTSSLIALTLVLVAIVLFAIMVYPGEMSHVSSSLNRRLYDRAAANYERKWASDAYRDLETHEVLRSFCCESIESSGVARVLDLGCGTGRAVRLLADVLPASTEFEAIDFSRAMLDRFREWLSGQEPALRDRVRIREGDLSVWAKDGPAAAQAGLVVLLEVGEFLAEFERVVGSAGVTVAPGGGLLMTRPAGLWWIFFAHRHQSRRSLTRLLEASGFEDVRYRPWRARYELVFARRESDSV